MNDRDVSLNCGRMDGIVIDEALFPVDRRVAIAADRGFRRFRRRRGGRSRLLLGKDVAWAIYLDQFGGGIDVNLAAQ